MERETTAALLGAVVGGGLTLIANLVQEYYRTAQRAKQLAHAVAGEVVAVLGIVSARHYDDLVQDAARRAHHGELLILKITANRKFFPTIEANLDSIGLLPGELPTLIPRLLILSNAILEDFDSIGALKLDAFNMHEGPREALQLATRYDELSGLLRVAVKTGQQIVSVVAAFYGAPHTRLPICLQLKRKLMRRTNAT